MSKKCIQCLDTLSVSTRMEIVRRLRKKPHNVSQIEDGFNLTQPTISYHLQVLKKAGIVRAKKRGREMHYFLNEQHLCKNCIIQKI